MGCLSSISYAILINGSPSRLFNALKGLRQGCPLSPFAFLLVVEGLSKLISNVRTKGDTKGVKI